MYYLLLLVVAIAPPVFVLLYFYFQDSKRTSPKGKIIGSFLLGMLFTIPVIMLEFVFGQALNSLSFSLFWKQFFRAFLVIAFIEEFFKLMVVMLFVYRRIVFDEYMDGIIYAMVVSIGFACTENIIYVLSGGFGVAILRSFTALPMHAIAAGIMGFYIGKAKFSTNKYDQTRQIYTGLLFAVLIHGIYDYVLLAIPHLKSIAAISIWIMLVSIFFVLLNKIKSATEKDLAMSELSG